MAVKTYSFKAALEASTAYFNGDELAANVWINKYALKDSAGHLYEKTPDDMHRRIAAEIARIEQKYVNPISEEAIYALLKNFKYIVPQGSPMAGIGNNLQVSSLSNCFVIGSEADSYGGIVRTDEEQVQLMKRRGGVGHDLSHIRPKGSPVMNSALSSTGIVPFMERYSNSTREVAQDGRRGALMLTVSVKHPDAEDFVDAKLELGKVTGANVSLRIDDAFMKAALNNQTYRQQYPLYSDNPMYVKEIDAAKLWDKIIYNAWKSAEPGVLFWDTIIRESVPDCYADLGYKTISTNPCGEIPLCPYDSCRLLAINLYSYVENPFTDKAYFNFEKFGEHVQIAQRIMDDIIDLEIEKIDRIIQKIDNDPEDEDIKGVERKLWEKIRKTCIEGRRTGVGITAEGDMLAALGIRYGSDEGIEFSVKVHSTLAINAYRSSTTLAKERGAFKIYDADREKNNPFILRLKEKDPQLYEDMVKYGRRNIALLTIAPTGTTSLMTQTSSGIEPVFLVSYTRRRKVNPNDKDVKVSFVDEVGDAWEEYYVFHHKFEDWLKANDYDVEAVKKMPQEELDKIIAQSPFYKATANDIDWVQKVKMQGAIQKWVDHSISVTVNIPQDTSVELVKEIYKTAWEHGCKGCTIYRDGSRSGVLVSNDKKEEKKEEPVAIIETFPPKRPRKLECEVIRFQNNHEKWLAVVGLIGDRPYEIFTGKAEDTFMLPNYVTSGWVIKTKDSNGENRYDFQFEDRDGYKVTIEGLSRSFDKEYWNYAKLISGILRHGMPLNYVVNLVQGLNVDQEHINNWKNGVVRALKKFIPDGTKAVKEECPACGDPDGLIYKEGCLMCKSCGHTECG
ncbi:MAG: adenosylcobalamin-dependent ribonucleoside-diphosphate reductase [Bacteroidetes bacterium]|nr:MAG: adenosylcobalamin-dependent ribonucleoside-diphosphate reductase [Bacteroidota bacterium]